MSKSGVYLVSASSVDEYKKPVKYTSPDEVNLKMADQKQTTSTPTTFRGMGKEELLQHSQRPFWVRLRMICISIVLIGWLALIITVVALVFAYPKCRDKEARSWWQNDAMYRIYVRSFYDSDGDGNGDIKGVHSKLDYISGLGVNTISLSPIFQMDATKEEFSVTDHRAVDSIFGTLQDLRDFVKAVHDKGMKILLDFIPNQTSDQHQWFINSKNSAQLYKNFYVWSTTSTNWITVNGSSAWTMDSTRNEYYLHQFGVGQPDLNLRSDLVMDELTKIMEYWMITENIDGLYIRSSGYLMEDFDMRDEAVIQAHELTYGLTSSRYTLSRFREISDKLSNTSTKILLADRTGSVSDKMMYLGAFPGSGVQLSLNPVDNYPCNGKCIRDYAIEWLNQLSTNKWPNWMTGFDESSRFPSRFPANYSRPFLMMSYLLPGTPIIYYGDELGMKDLPLTDNAMRGLMQWENSTNAGFQNCSTTCGGSPWIGANSDYQTINAKAASSDGSLYKFIKELSTLRSNDAFLYGEYKTAVATDNIFSFVREFDGVTGYLVAVNFGDRSEEHDYTAYHSTIQNPAVTAMTTGSDVGFSAADEDEVDTTSLSLGPLQGIVVSWDYKAKEL